MSLKIDPTLAKIFAAHKVSFGYLFGSRAQGKVHPRSDRDIAVRFRSGIAKNIRFDLRLKLWNKLSDIWPGETVDLIDLEEAPLLLQFRAIQPGNGYTKIDLAKVYEHLQNEVKRFSSYARHISRYVEKH